MNLNRIILFERLKPWLVSILILPVCIYLLMHRGDYSFIDNADLVIHEAGHFFFRLFGKFIYTAAGSLMQIFIPSLITWYFFTKFYRTGVQIALLWLGQNLLNISVYAADARAKSLHLLGGSKVYHDWNYMLGTLHLLNYDSEIGYFFVALSVIVFIVAFLMPLIIPE